VIKDIVVKLSVGERASPAEDYAVSVAATFDAHLTGIAFLYYPIVPVADAGYTLADIYGSRSGAGNIPPEMIDTLQLDNAAATKAAIDRFATASARAGVSAEPLTPRRQFRRRRRPVRPHCSPLRSLRCRASRTRDGRD